MGRKKVLGDTHPTKEEVAEALKLCQGLPDLREELQKLEQELADLEEGLKEAASTREHDLYEYMLSGKKDEYERKLAQLKRLILSVMSIPHKKAKAAVSEYYLNGKLLKEAKDMSGELLGVNATRYYKKLGLELLALELKKYDKKASEKHTNSG